MTASMKLFQRFYYNQIGKNCLISVASWRNFKATVSFPGLLVRFVDDRFDGNMAVLAEFHNFYLSLVEEKLGWFAAKCFK